MNNWTWTALGVLLIATACRGELEAEGFLWLADPRGTVSAGLDGLAGTTVDLKDDLGYNGNETVWGIGLRWGERHQIGATYFQANASAGGNINREFTFYGLRFPVTLPVRSSLDALFARVFYRLNLTNEYVGGGICAGAQYNDLSAEISAPYIGSAKGEVRNALPFAGLHVSIRPIPELIVRGRIDGSTWDYGNARVAFLDVELAALYKTPFGLYGGGGFRHIDIDARDTSQPADIDMTFTGPILLAGFDW